MNKYGEVVRSASYVEGSYEISRSKGRLGGWEGVFLPCPEFFSLPLSHVVGDTNPFPAAHTAI